MSQQDEGKKKCVCEREKGGGRERERPVSVDC